MAANIIVGDVKNNVQNAKSSSRAESVMMKSNIKMKWIRKRIIKWIDILLYISSAWIANIFKLLNNNVKNAKYNLQDTFVKFVTFLIIIGNKKKYFTVTIVEYAE